jgi:hypothetical protein
VITRRTVQQYGGFPFAEPHNQYVVR